MSIDLYFYGVSPPEAISLATKHWLFWHHFAKSVPNIGGGQTIFPPPPSPNTWVGVELFRRGGDNGVATIFSGTLVEDSGNKRPLPK